MVFPQASLLHSIIFCISAAAHIPITLHFSTFASQFNRTREVTGTHTGFPPNKKKQTIHMPSARKRLTRITSTIIMVMAVSKMTKTLGIKHRVTFYKASTKGVTEEWRAHCLPWSHKNSYPKVSPKCVLTNLITLTGQLQAVNKNYQCGFQVGGYSCKLPRFSSTSLIMLSADPRSGKKWFNFSISC